MTFIEIFVEDPFSFSEYTIQVSGTNAAGESIKSDEFTIDPYIPSSIVCFLEGTDILTDQGYVEIQKLEPGIHTVDDYKLECITITKSLEPFLIKLSANCFGKNVPSRDLITTFHHKICINDIYVEAGYCLNYPGVEAIEYEGQLLYNIVLEDYHHVNVYNLMCETLHPNCAVAKYFMHENNTKRRSKIQTHIHPLCDLTAHIH